MFKLLTLSGRSARAAALVGPMLAVLISYNTAGALPADWPELGGPVAIKGATVFARPGERLEQATVLIAEGRIAAAGTDVTLPPGTRVLEGAGLFVYAGFVDGFTRAGVETPVASEAEERRIEGDFPGMEDGPLVASAEANRQGIAARRRAEDLITVSGDTYARQREAGFTAALIAPPRAILGGRATLLSLGAGPLRKSVLRSDVAQTASFSVPPQRAMRIRGSYPATPLGVIALARQTFADAGWFAALGEWTTRHPQAYSERPYDADLTALQPVLERRQRVIWEANTRDEIERALRLADEFGFEVVIAGGREAWKAADVLKQRGVPVILAVEKLPEPRKYELALDKLRRDDGDDSVYGRNWADRPFYPRAAYETAGAQRAQRLRNAQALEEQGVAWCFSTLALERPGDLTEIVREMIELGLSPEAALRGLTTSPAALAGAGAQTGAIAAGMRGNMTVLTQPIEKKDAKVRWTIIDGQVFEFDVTGRARDDEGGRARRGGGRAPERGGVDTRRPAGDEPASDEGASATEAEPAHQAASESQPASAASQPATALERVLAHEPNWPLETEADRTATRPWPGDKLITGVHIITVSGEDLHDSSILIRGGKIAALGRLEVPPGVVVIDLPGYVVMPGIIDPHSHMALDAINEFSASVTPEVRCEDVVVHDDDALFRALAGGCTTIHFMHGSANTIGGQCGVMKLKYGAPASEMLMPDRVRTVKWALGENVIRGGKRGNRRDPAGPLRFPGTRMGVEATLRRALAAGQVYQQEREAFAAAAKAGQDPRPMRRDLRLEALADILRGDIWVNTHCYRADEILRLMNVAEDFGIRIAVLHHVLEGYRIMPEIARHGSGTATFADWWAYKVESYDAVPHNAGMLLRAGVNSALKSDSGDLVRHMNQEAAKCLKYSGLTPNEALRLITLNAARQFGLDKRIGSIEVGKDADLAIYNGHPLDTWSRCVMTLVDGEVFFRDEELRADDAPQARPLKPFAPQAVESRPAPFADVPITPETIFAIINATLHPVSGPAIENGTLVMQNGRIASLGAAVTVPPGARVLDAKGLHVWPGLINAGTQTGMQEIEQVDVTIDTGETGEYQPDVLAVSGLNPHSAMVRVTRAEGITTALLVPTSPTIAGQAGLVDLDGWTLNEMLIDSAVGLVVTLPTTRVKPLLDEPEPDDLEEGPPARRRPREHDAQRRLRDIERFFRNAKRYADARLGPAIAGDGAGAALPGGLRPDPRFDALVPYVTGRKRVLFRANSYQGILEALLFAERLELGATILGGRDAWKLADVLAERGVPVIYEGVFATPASVPGLYNTSDRWDANYRAPGVMSRAGVRFCASYMGADLAKLMPLDLGFAIAYGLEPDAAVRAMTLSAAEILGVEKSLGSLDVGKVANVIVTTDHPCQAANRIEYMFIRGRPVDLVSKHTREAGTFSARPAAELPPPRTDLKGPPPQSAGERATEAER